MTYLGCLTQLMSAAGFIPYPLVGRHVIDWGGHQSDLCCEQVVGETGLVFPLYRYCCQNKGSPRNCCV